METIHWSIAIQALVWQVWGKVRNIVPAGRKPKEREPKLHPIQDDCRYRAETDGTNIRSQDRRTKLALPRADFYLIYF